MDTTLQNEEKETFGFYTFTHSYTWKTSSFEGTQQKFSKSNIGLNWCLREFNENIFLFVVNIF